MITDDRLGLKRFGLFGGTFNPIHLGHLSVAKEVKEGFKLTKLYFIPASIPPHKQAKKLADAFDRLEMIRLAISDYENFYVSDIELKRSGLSYTIDTLDHLKNILPKETQLYFIIGMDAFLEIDTWKSFRELFEATSFIVMSRPGALPCELKKKLKALEKLLVMKVSSDFRFNKDRNAFFHRNKQPVFLFDVTPVDISATMVRERISQGKSITSFVPEKVKNYIEAKGLYL